MGIVDISGDNAAGGHVLERLVKRARRHHEDEPHVGASVQVSHVFHAAQQPQILRRWF
jgi:hypothetical protein